MTRPREFHRHKLLASAVTKFRKKFSALEMRLAVFTNQFPSRTSTFFARDIRPLLDAGIEVDVFAIYPLDPVLWRYVPNILGETVLPRSKVHHLTFAEILRSANPWPTPKLFRVLHETATISASAVQFGGAALAKSGYALLKAWAWAREFGDNYDHLLAYWGNYAGTCAYVFHRLVGREIPFSMFLHAGIDLYGNQVYLRQKLLYSDNIFTCSKFNRQFLREHFSDIFPLVSDKIHLHYHGLDFAEFRYEPADRLPGRIVGVGALEKYKGFEYLLRAAHLLSIRRVQYEIELVGDGTEADSLKSLARELQILDKVTFRGWLRPDEVRSAMRQATILVHPSAELADGVPNVIKEAMALGTPVIASTVAGIPELLERGKNGILVPPRDVKALAKSIETLLTSESLRQQYAKAARAHAENEFDLWQSGKRLAEILCSTTRQSLRNHGRTSDFLS